MENQMTATQDTYEHHFITHDKAPTPAGDIDVTFNLIEDERGDIYWGYGHVAQSDFVVEVNRWLEHVGCDGGEIPDTTPVDHLWAKYENDGDERFELVKDYGSEVLKKAADVFPVTRLWI